METEIKQFEPLKGTFFLLKDGKIVEKYDAKNVKDAFELLGSKIPFGLGKYIKRDNRGVGDIMIGSHVYEIKPLIV